MYPLGHCARLPKPSRRAMAQVGPHSLLQQLLGIKPRLTSAPPGDLSSDSSDWKGREPLSMVISKLGLKETRAGFPPQDMR